MHDSWIKHSCSGLSEPEIKRKLEEINTTPQIDIFLKPIRDVNEEVLSKTGKIAEVEKELESKKLQQSRLVETLQQDIETKNSYVEQVHGTHEQKHKHAHYNASPINVYLPCDENAYVQYVPMHDS